MATQLSAISFISAPAFVGLRPGGGMSWLTFEFGVPLAMVIIMVVVIPPLYKSGVVSVYEYLERRFDASSRLLISFVFQISRSFGTGVMVYAVALILQSVMNIQFWQTIIIIGVITLIYSFQGGMRAVVFGDMIQMLILFAGILISLGYGLYEIGGWHQFVSHLDTNRLMAVDFSKFGIHGDGFGFWPMLVGGIFLYTSYYGTDQTQSQRMLSARDMGTIRKLLTVNGLFRFPITFIYSFMGLVLGALYFSDPSFQSALQQTFALHSNSLKSSTDLLVPVFIIKYLPNGIIGLLLVAILSAAMSSLSSTINSLSAVTVEDFIKRFKKMDDTQYVRVSRFVSLFWGAVCILFAFVAGGIADTVIEAINKIGSVFYGPVLAAFLLAILSKRTRALGANVGIITGVLVNVYLWLFVPQIFWFWWNAIGTIVTVVVALGVSQLSVGKPVKLLQVDKFQWKTKENFILAGYFVLIVLFSVSLTYIF
jgi:SSS family transporter